MSGTRWVEWLWVIGLLLLALIHLTPVSGVLGGAALQRLYGVAADTPELALLLRHRAVLFAVVGGLMVLAIFAPGYRLLALAVGWISLLSFVLLAAQIGPVNDALTRVIKVDYVALAILTGLSLISLAGDVRGAGQTP